MHKMMRANSATLLLLLLISSGKPLTISANDRLQSIRYDGSGNGYDLYSAQLLPQNYHDHDDDHHHNHHEPQPHNHQVAGIQNLKVLLQQQPNQYEQQQLRAAPLAGQADSLQPPASSAPRRMAKQIASFGRLSAASGEQPSDKVCLTPGCVKAAAEILKNMDDKVNPCDDFYRYSCGNWIDAQVIPEDKTSVSLFSVVQDELDNKLRNLIEREPSEKDSPIVGGMRNLYESCMNTSHIERIGNSPMLETIKQLGGWPLLGGGSASKSAAGDKFDWLDMLIKFRNMGFSHDILIDLSVTPDFRNNTRHIIDVSIDRARNRPNLPPQLSMTPLTPKTWHTQQNNSSTKFRLECQTGVTC